MTRDIPQRFRHTLLGLINRPYISASLARAARPLILHISDTPRITFPYLYRIARQLAPEYLVHTGDIVDDIKLEVRPQEVGAYRREVAAFLPRLEHTPAGSIYLVPGNHDDVSVLAEHSSRAEAVPDGTVLELAGLSVAVSHKYDELIDGGDFYLFGHTPLPDHHERGGMVCLNGVATMSVIEVPSRRVHLLPYPSGTDSVRKLLLPKPGL
jgi:predicted phosphodiesterase